MFISALLVYMNNKERWIAENVNVIDHINQQSPCSYNEYTIKTLGLLLQECLCLYIFYIQVTKLAFLKRKHALLITSTKNIFLSRRKKL